MGLFFIFKIFLKHLYFKLINTRLVDIQLILLIGGGLFGKNCLFLFHYIQKRHTFYQVNGTNNIKNNNNNNNDDDADNSKVKGLVIY